MRKLCSQGTIKRYDQVKRNQIEAGIVERVPGPVSGRQDFYISHQPVVLNPQKPLRFVAYNASACANSGAPSLNECLNPGPPL